MAGDNPQKGHPCLVGDAKRTSLKTNKKKGRLWAAEGLFASASCCLSLVSGRLSLVDIEQWETETGDGNQKPHAPRIEGPMHAASNVDPNAPDKQCEK